MFFSQKRNLEIFALLYLILIVSFFKYGEGLWKIFINSKFLDFNLYYVYSDMVSKGVNPFGPNIVVTVGGIQQTANYLPLFYLAMKPLTFFSFAIASKLWLVSNQIFISLTLLLILRIVSGASYLFVFTGLIFLLGNFFPIFDNNFLGQANVLVLFLLTLSLFLVLRRNYLIAAILLAFVTHVKLQFILFVQALFFAGYRKFSLTALLFLGFGWLLSIAFAGLDQNISYVKYILNFPKELYLWPGNISTTANITRLFGFNNFVSNLNLLFTAIFTFGFLVFLKFRSSYINVIKLWCLIILAALLISPLLEIHHLAISFLPMSFLLLNNEKGSLKNYHYVLVAIFVFLSGNWLIVNLPPDTVFGLGTLPLTIRTLGLFGLFVVFLKLCSKTERVTRA